MGSAERLVQGREEKWKQPKTGLRNSAQTFRSPRTNAGQQETNALGAEPLGGPLRFPRQLSSPQPSFLIR